MRGADGIGRRSGRRPPGRNETDSPVEPRLVFNRRLPQARGRHREPIDRPEAALETLPEETTR